jgi:hypothetical protein
MRSARQPYSRPLLFAAIVAVHGALIWLAQREWIRLPARADEPLLLFLLPREPPPIVRPVPLSRWAQPERVPQFLPPAPAAVPTPGPALPAPQDQPQAQSPLDIDWSAEAAIAAQHQAELAAAPKPRSLDDHHRHGNHHDGVGLNSKGPYQFGWYYAGTHRVDTSSGLPLIHLNDRCVLTFGFLIPLPLCGIGEIPVKGDLFQHMHDPPPDPAAPP